MQTVIALIKEMQTAVEIPARKENNKNIDQEDIEAANQKAKASEMAESWLAENVDKILFDKSYYTKGERKAAVKAIKEGLDSYLFEQGLKKDMRAHAIKTSVEKRLTPLLPKPF